MSVYCTFYNQLIIIIFTIYRYLVIGQLQKHNISNTFVLKAYHYFRFIKFFIIIINEIHDGIVSCDKLWAFTQDPR